MFGGQVGIAEVQVQWSNQPAWLLDDLCQSLLTDFEDQTAPEALEAVIGAVEG